MKFKTFIIAVMLGFAFQAPVHAEFIFITDGSILQGNITADTADSITVALKDNGTKVIKRSTIMRILYTEFYMGKIFVNKIDGTVLEVYMVDEDQNTFTFRKDLNKPQEFVLKREEVLFTTRTNPVGLTGKPKGDGIAIEWKAPYTPVRHYRVYVKSGKEYKLYSEPMGKSETLTGLKSNAEYRIKVTAVDNSGLESMPSNEIKVITPNIPPDPPGKIKVRREIEKNRKKMNVVLTWPKAVDIDGRIRNYRIYQKDRKDFYTSNTNEYEIKNLDPGQVYFFNITAVDDHNVESEKSRGVTTYDYLGYNLSMQPEYIIPLGKLKKIQKSGAGALISLTKENVFAEKLDIGIVSGYWQFQSLPAATSETDYSMMIPLAVTAGYRFSFFSSISIIPHASLGCSFNFIKYRAEPDLYTGYNLDRIKNIKWSVEPLFLGGITLEYDITHRMYLTAGGDFGMLLEMSGIVPFVTAAFGAGMRF